MATYTQNYGLSKPENTDTMAAFMNDYAANMETIDQNLGGGGGGGGGGHTIIDENGNTMPTRSKLKFEGNVKVTDDNANGQTVVNIQEIYTETERVVGEFCGKPLYQICIPFSGINTAANTWYAFNISAFLTNPEIVFTDRTMVYYIVNGVERLFSDITYEAPNYLFKTPVARSNISGRVTVRYTKTTD